MVVVALALFLMAVVLLTMVSRRSDRPAESCCAPSDPADDLRMRDL